MMTKIIDSIKRLQKEYMEAVDYQLDFYGGYKDDFKHTIYSINKFCKEIKHNPSELYKKPQRSMQLFFENLERGVKWFIRGWNTRNDDDYFLIEMIVQKLKDMKYQFDVVDADFCDMRHQPLMECNKYVTYLKCGNSDTDFPTIDLLKGLDQAIELGEKILKGDYVKYPENVQQWIDTHSSIFVDKMPTEVYTDMMNAHSDAEKEEKKDRDEFFNLLKDNHEYWND